MYFDEYGKGNKEIIVFLHPYGNVHGFREQYCLEDRYHIFVPHLLGFGNSVDKIFEINEQISQLAELIGGLNQKIFLCGFSLGAIVAFKLISDHPDLFKKAILVSPYLLGDKNLLKGQTEEALRGLKIMQNRLLGPVVAALSGVPRNIRKGFVDQMRNMKKETIVNAMNNGVCFDTVKGFPDAAFQIVVVVGGKEHDVVKESAKKLCALNSNCSYVEYEEAAHNVPTKFSDQFNSLIVSAFC